jgi:hypothetical protein
VPLLTADHTIAVADTPELFAVRVGPHMIVHAAVMDMQRAYPNDAVWCEIGLMSGQLLETGRVAVLAQGFCGAYNPVAWDGRIPAMDDHRVYAMVIGTVSTTWRLSVGLYKIISDEGGAFRLDP